MKKKGTVDRIRLSSLSTFFIVAAVATLSLRIYLFFWNYIKPEDGAWAKQSPLITLFYVLIALGAALLVIMPLLSKHIPKTTLPQCKSKQLGAAGLVLFFGLLIDVASQVGNIIKAQDAVSAAGAGGAFLKESGMLPNLLQVLFGLFAALYMLLFSLSYFKGKNIYTSSKLLALTPTVWIAARLISRFMRPANFLNNTELFLELIMLCFAMIFFFVFSRIASQIGHKGKMWMLFGTGFAAALFALLCSVPRLALYIAGYGHMTVPDSQLEYADLAVVVFIVLLLFDIISEAMAGNYERYDEDNAFFDFTKKDTDDLVPVGEVVPDVLTAAEQVSPAPDASHTASQEDEAFEIAAQYSNQYMQAFSEEPGFSAGDYPSPDAWGEESEDE